MWEATRLAVRRIAGARLTDLTRTGWVVLVVALVAIVQLGSWAGPRTMQALSGDVAPSVGRLISVAAALPIVALCGAGFALVAAACGRFGAPVLQPVRVARTQQREP